MGYEHFKFSFDNLDFSKRDGLERCLSVFEGGGAIRVKIPYELRTGLLLISVPQLTSEVEATLTYENKVNPRLSMLYSFFRQEGIVYSEEKVKTREVISISHYSTL